MWGNHNPLRRACETGARGGDERDCRNWGGGGGGAKVHDFKHGEPGGVHIFWFRSSKRRKEINPDKGGRVKGSLPQP